MSDYGCSVVIAHEDGYYSLYAHMAEGTIPNVWDAQGNWVWIYAHKDMPLGIMSNIYRQAEVHLHFAVRQGPEGIQGDQALYANGGDYSMNPVDIWQEIPSLQACVSVTTVCQHTE